MERLEANWKRKKNKNRGKNLKKKLRAQVCREFVSRWVFYKGHHSQICGTSFHPSPARSFSLCFACFNNISAYFVQNRVKCNAYEMNLRILCSEKVIKIWEMMAQCRISRKKDKVTQQIYENWLLMIGKVW